MLANVRKDHSISLIWLTNMAAVTSCKKKRSNATSHADVLRLATLGKPKNVYLGG